MINTRTHQLGNPDPMCPKPGQVYTREEAEAFNTFSPGTIFKESFGFAVVISCEHHISSGEYVDGRCTGISYNKITLRRLTKAEEDVYEIIES